MKVSSYHKKRGDNVEIYSPFFSYDKIYAFSIFDYTDKGYVKKGMICGGTGFNVMTKLPPEIEECDYDWSLYPKCDFSLIWFSHGCNRCHPYCCVWKMHGKVKESLPKNLNPKGKHIKIMDDNFFQNPNWKDCINKIKEWNQPVDFQAIDVRLINKEMCDALNELTHFKQIGISWDNPKEDLLPKIKEMIKYIPPYKIRCYILIGYWSTEEEDLYRIETLRDLKIDPFVMPFNKKDKYQRKLARYVNFKSIFKSITWKEYNETNNH